MKIAFFCGLTLLLAGCGGEQAGGFQNSIYVEIKQDSSVNPVDSFARNGARVTFLNNSGTGHSINWTGAFASTGTMVQSGDRVWFDLPPAVTGTTFNFRLDAGGATGTVTIIGQ